MKKELYVAALLLIFLLPCRLYAGALKGKVTDTKGEPMPFATVFVQGTTMGTTTNAEGIYQLTLQPGSYKVLCQYIGFGQTSFTVSVKGEEIINHDFVLKDQALEMKTVVVKANAEDPAYGIMRKVIKRRKFHLEQAQSFQSGIYLKGVLRNRLMPNSIAGIMKKDDAKEFKDDLGLDSAGRGVLYLCEEQADYYATKGKSKTVIHSVRTSGNPNGLGFESMLPVVSFYYNNVNPISGLSPRGFISPVSDNAISYYKFKYEGEFRENGFTIDKIRVTPRRLYEPLFDGVIYIVEDDWAIHSLSLTATKTSNLSTLDTLRIEQKYLQLKKDMWVIKNQLLYPTIKIFGFDVTGYFVTVYDNQKINEPIPDTIFNNKIVSVYDKQATKKDTSYWTASRPVPLQEDEARDYVVKDSLRIKFSDPRYIDSMRKRDNKVGLSNILLTGLSFSTKMYKNTFRTNSLLNVKYPLVSYNTVEGVAVAPKIWWTHVVDSFTNINTTVAARYGFSNTHFNSIARISYLKNNRHWHGNWWKAGVEGGKYRFQFNPQSNVYPFYNTISTLFYAQNYMKLYEAWQAAAFFEKDHGNGFSWRIRPGFQKRLMLNNTTDVNWAKGGEEKLTDNVPQVLSAWKWEEHNAALLDVTLTYQPGFSYTLYPDFKESNYSRLPVFSLNYVKGIPGIFNSKTDFDKWRFSITDNLNLKLLGTLSYNIAAGGFLNSKYVSLPDLKHYSDNQMAIAAPYLNSFQLMPYYRFSNAEPLYGELHLEYALKGLLTNKIPLLRQAQWYLVLGTNSLYINNNKYYTEVFAGVDNLGYKAFRFLRVDVVRSWDSFNQPAIGVRVGLRTSGLIRVSFGSDDGDGTW